MLRWTEFEDLAVEFLHKSSVVGDTWEWRAHEENRPGLSYLAKSNHVLRFGAVPPKTAESGEVCALEGEKLEQHLKDFEVAVALPSAEESDGTTFIYEYHILYSTSYQVPVLYFNGYHLDGAPLTWEEVWENLDPVYKNEKLRWTFVTQKEHPVLGTPFFHIHPCETKLLMGVVQQYIASETFDGPSDNDRHNYLVTWLSLVGPVVGIKLPLLWM